MSNMPNNHQRPLQSTASADIEIAAFRTDPIGEVAAHVPMSDNCKLHLTAKVSSQPKAPAAGSDATAINATGDVASNATDAADSESGDAAEADGEGDADDVVEANGNATMREDTQAEVAEVCVAREIIEEEIEEAAARQMEEHHCDADEDANGEEFSFWNPRLSDLTVQSMVLQAGDEPMDGILETDASDVNIWGPHPVLEANVLLPADVLQQDAPAGPSDRHMCVPFASLVMEEEHLAPLEAQRRPGGTRFLMSNNDSDAFPSCHVNAPSLRLAQQDSTIAHQQPILQSIAQPVVPLQSSTGAVDPAAGGAPPAAQPPANQRRRVKETFEVQWNRPCRRWDAVPVGTLAAMVNRPTENQVESGPPEPVNRPNEAQPCSLAPAADFLQAGPSCPRVIEYTCGLLPPTYSSVPVQSQCGVRSSCTYTARPMCGNSFFPMPPPPDLATFNPALPPLHPFPSWFPYGAAPHDIVPGLIMAGQPQQHQQCPAGNLPPAVSAANISAHLHPINVPPVNHANNPIQGQQGIPRPFFPASNNAPLWNYNDRQMQNGGQLQAPQPGMYLLQTLQAATAQQGDQSNAAVANDFVTSTGNGNYRGTRFRDDIAKHLKCPICGLLAYRPVVLLPCMHRVCGSCIGQHVKRGNSATCPDNCCRGRIQDIRRDTVFRDLADTFARHHPGQAHRITQIRDARDSDRLWKAFCQRNIYRLP